MKPVTRIIFPVFLALFMLLTCCSPKATYAPVSPDIPVQFPRDLYAHHDHRTEWWYHTGHFTTADGLEYGFELVFFRHRSEGLWRLGIPVWKLSNPIYFAHFAITEVNGKHFEYAENVAVREGLDGGSLEDRLMVWCRDWKLEGFGENTRLTASMPDGSFDIDLVLSPQKPPIVHGKNGISHKGQGGATSYYISVTRYSVQGFLRRNGIPVAVKSGSAWMDHEIFSGSLSENIKGWDWFSIQLDNKTELMAFLLHDKKGGIDTDSSGTFIDVDGKSQHFEFNEFSIRETLYWKSPTTRTRYPVGWVLHVPKYNASLEIRAVMPDQELLCPLSGIDYWEGAVKIEGQISGRPVTGKGYVEMSGRSGELSGL